MELKNMTNEVVAKVMTEIQPDWHIRWATQRDLQDALRVEPKLQAGFLQGRLSELIILVLCAAYALEKREAA